MIFGFEEYETGNQAYADGALKEKNDKNPHQAEALLWIALINLYKESAEG